MELKQEEVKTILSEGGKKKIVVYNETTGERYEVAEFNAEGDAVIAMKALQKAAPKNMKYSFGK